MRSRWLLVLTLVFAVAATPRASAEPPPGQRFVAVALHDVVDTRDALDEDAVTADRLVGLFEWLLADGWTAVSLDDIERARRGERPLPDKAVLLSFDDGYRSLYTRVYPLALAYRMPVVAALVGAWVDAPPGATVRYAERDVPRAHFISWAQAREMQASGVVEFAAHSYGLHDVVPANPQGNLLPAAVTRRYMPGQGYEDEAAMRARLQADLARVRDVLKRELGRAPRAIVWPYGRYNDATVAAARATGYSFALTLDGGPGDARAPMAIPRYLPVNDPVLGEWAANLRHADPWPSARRLVCVDPARLASDDPREADRRLGVAIERLRTLGATHVVIDAAVRDGDGNLVAAWFPNTQLPVRADLLSRLAAQMRVRGGVTPVVRLPHRAALQRLGSRERVLRLYDALGAAVPVDALLVEDLSLPAGADTPSIAAAPWDVRAARRALDATGWRADDALALDAFRAVAAHRSGLEWFRLAATGESIAAPWPFAEVTLLPLALAADAQPGLDVPAGAAARRIGAWWPSSQPPSAARLIAAARDWQVRGGTVLGWCPDDPLADAPAAAELAPAVSAATFPREGGRPRREAPP